jgi:hypothetical protein
LKESSDLFKVVREAVRKNSPSAPLGLEKIESMTVVSGYASMLFPLMVRFVGSIHSSSASERQERLSNVLELYRILQEDVEDTDVRLIFKWWLPQAVETLAILASAKATEFDVTKAVFEETSAHAIYLLFGEYLVLEQSLPSTNSKPIQEEGVQLGQQYNQNGGCD